MLKLQVLLNVHVILNVVVILNVDVIKYVVVKMDSALAIRKKQQFVDVILFVHVIVHIVGVIKKAN